MITSTYAQQNELFKFGFFCLQASQLFLRLQVDTPVMMREMKHFAQKSLFSSTH